MLFRSANSNYNIVQINNVFIWAFFFRILLSLIFDTFDFRTDENIGRLGETFNPNLISHGALFLISCIGLKKVLTDKLSIINYFQFFLAVYTIFLAASRSTAISLVILFTGIIFIVISTSKSMLTRYVILLMIALFLPATVYILNNTGVGVRLVDAYYSTIYAPSQEAMFDNRLWQYIHGLDLFKENPILGIGLNNFINTGRIHIVAHSEYIVQLAECGLIGFFLWLIFYKTIVVRLIKVRSMSSEHRNISNYFITFIVSMLFLMSSTPFYSKEEFWVILALIIKYTETSMSFIDNTAPTDNIIA